MENLNELYQAILAGGERCTRHASVTKAVFLGAEPFAPRCRTLCSPVPNPLLPGAGEMPRSEGIWDGGW